MKTVVGRLLRPLPQPVIHEIAVTADPVMAAAVGWETRPPRFVDRLDGTTDCSSVFGIFYFDRRNKDAIADELASLAAQIRSIS
jgi:hypothetical protein